MAGSRDVLVFFISPDYMYKSNRNQHETHVPSSGVNKLKTSLTNYSLLIKFTTATTSCPVK